MKTTILTLFSFLLVFSSIHAQTPVPVVQIKKCIGGSASDWGQSIVNTSDGGYVIGGYKSSSDGDLNCTPASSVFLTKLNAEGNIVWKTCLIESGGSIITVNNTHDGGFILIGSAFGPTFPGYHGGVADIYIAKVNRDGVLIWQKYYGGSMDDRGGNIILTDGGYMFIASTTSNDGDISGGHGLSDVWVVNIDESGNITRQKCYGTTGSEGGDYVTIQQTTDGGYAFAATGVRKFSSTSGADMWFVKLNAAGDVSWETGHGGSNADEPKDFKQTADGGYIVVLDTESFDGEVPAGGGAFTNIWVCRLNADGTLRWSGKYGANGPDKSNEVLIDSDGGFIVLAQKGYNRFDNFVVYGLNDAWVVKFRDQAPATFVWEKTFGGTFNDDLTSMVFNSDNALVFTGRTQSNNFDAVDNHGSEDVWFIKTQAVLATPSISGIAASYCAEQGMQRGKINNLPAAASGINTVVKLDGNALTVAADSTFTFNVSSLAVGSHVLEVTYSTGSDTRTTTVNFSITAAVTPNVNLSANNVVAANLIDPVIITAANAAGGGSNPLYTFAKDRNFVNILQAEGSNNVLNISPTALQNGDNWIYVRMKTSSTCFTAQFNIDSIKITLQLPVPNQPVITGINASYCVNEGLQKAKITNYPAAGTGSTVTVKLNGNPVTVAADSSFSFNVTTLGAGNHVAEITFTNPSGTKTTLVNFTVNALATPDVNVTANIRNVSDLNNPIIITASNASGGGQTPVYTFARNRTFTDVLKAEGAEPTLTLAANALKLGENWIYVRMKTSSTCYSQQTAIDSIRITRFGSKGLIDPDYPDQVITSTPNPFRNQINVYGLSADKSYTIILYNEQGQVMYRLRVSSRTTAMLRVPGYAAGIYLLGIYDETKNRFIGTLNLLKQ